MINQPSPTLLYYAMAITVSKFTSQPAAGTLRTSFFPLQVRREEISCYQARPVLSPPKFIRVIIKSVKPTIILVALLHEDTGTTR